MIIYVNSLVFISLSNINLADQTNNFKHIEVTIVVSIKI